MKKLFNFSLLLAFALIIASCGSKKSRPLAESVSSFLNGNETIVGFGSLRIGDILTKSGYEEQTTVKALVGQTVNQLSNSFNLNEPVYYAMEGPLNNNPTAYLFIEVKNIDSLKANLTKNSFQIEKGSDFEYVQDGEVTLGFNKHLAIGIIKSGLENPKDAIKKLFDRTQGDVSTGHVADILAKKDDIVYGTSLANLYGTSNTDLATLSADKQKELRAMVQNSFVETGLRFENGVIVMETKNHFSDALKSKLFFTKDPGAKILTNLGKGKPFMGASLNIDAKKLQEFLNEFAPNAIKDFSEDTGGEFELAMAVVNYDISKLIDGRVGVIGFAELDALFTTPSFNFFLGLAGHGKTFGTAIQNKLKEDFEIVNLTDSGIFGYSSETYSGNDVKLSEASKDFGKNSFNLFIDLSDADLESLELGSEMKFIELIKYITFEYGVEGGKVVIKARDDKENILKQAFKKGMNIVQEEMMF